MPSNFQRGASMLGQSNFDALKARAGRGLKTATTHPNAPLIAGAAIAAIPVTGNAYMQFRRHRLNVRTEKRRRAKEARLQAQRLTNTTGKNKNTQRTTTKGHRGTARSAATSRPGTRSSDLRNVNRGGGRRKKTNWVKDSQGRFAGSR